MRVFTYIYRKIIIELEKGLFTVKMKDFGMVLEREAKETS